MNIKKAHILLIEDSETHVATIRESLVSGPSPFQVTVARSLAEARAILGRLIPDLAIIEYCLPDGRGSELLPNGQEEPVCPAIILTDSGDEATAAEAMKVGALDYVPKSSAALADMHRIAERALGEWRHLVASRQAGQSLQTANRQLQDIIEFLPDATFVIDRENKVIAWNRGMEEITGVAKEEILGQDNQAYAYAFYGTLRPLLIDLLGNPDPGFEEIYDLFGRQEGTLYAEGFVPNLYNGKGAYIWGKASLLLDQNGNRAGAIESLRDITERKEAEENIKKANRELESFAYTVSHDLRTPLTAIVGYADVLRESCEDRLNEQELQILSEISDSGQKMQALMTDLLTLAKAGQVDRPVAPYDAGEVIREVARGLAETLKQAEVTVTIGVLPTLRVPRTLLTLVFDNLIGNAIRYGSKPGDVVEVGGEREGEKVRLYVRDHGPGISPEERTRIFEVFYQGTAGMDANGTGIGLATVQKIAGLFDGRAWMEETMGGGSTFWIELVDSPVGSPVTRGEAR